MSNAASPVVSCRTLRDGYHKKEAPRPRGTGARKSRRRGRKTFAHRDASALERRPVVGFVKPSRGRTGIRRPDLNRDNLSLLAENERHQANEPAYRQAPQNQAVLSDLFELFNEEAATNHAFKLAMKVILPITARIGVEVHPPSVSSDGDGGIVLDWVRSPKRVRLVIRDNADLPSYIYHQSGDQYKAEYEVTSKGLNERLDWLMKG